MIEVGSTDKRNAAGMARREIDKAAKSGIALALVKMVRIAKGFLLFFDREEFRTWAADKCAEKGVYSTKAGE